MSDKKPTLFYYDKQVTGAWVVASEDYFDFVSAEDLEPGEVVTVQFKREDMTPEEIDALPEG